MNIPALKNLPSDPDTLKAMLQDALQQIAHLTELVNLFRRNKYGPSSEKYAGQPCLFNEAEEALPDVETTKSPVKEHIRNRAKRRPLPANLPRIEHVYELSEQEKMCECCQKSMTEIGEEVSEQLDVVPAKVRVLRHRRKKYACSSCKEGVKIAKAPIQPLPKTNASPGLLAFVTTAKYVDGLPLYRQEEIFRRLGVDMSRATLSRWMIGLAELLRPLYNFMEEDLLEGPLILMDETPVQVLKGTGKYPNSKSYMWIRCRIDEKKIVLFNYDPSRSSAAAARLLHGFSGGLLTDAYKVYASVSNGKNIINYGCWDHARRKFDEALKGMGKNRDSSIAKIAMNYIQSLYMIERNLKDLDPEQRKKSRSIYSWSILRHLKKWLDNAINSVLPKSLTGKALSYLNGEWHRLIRYIDDGNVPISNAIAENAIRPFSIGRKNWLFSDTKNGAEASAILYSLVETAKLNKREPYEYLRHVIGAIPNAQSSKDFESLLPYI